MNTEPRLIPEYIEKSPQEHWRDASLESDSSLENNSHKHEERKVFSEVPPRLPLAPRKQPIPKRSGNTRG